ncbi:MAG TPA: Gfo/Idh/MocA family oxidoreductase [Candidatus Hydrogenedentes bacterium]|mgnify:CR=1 FL=1|nr:Gfo/Idh/MocA family oxidoreductase [Candidatus Hydrogenedentota bacterium]HOL75429.1 Gfo/Idh/MocA family oxidoreductase [Candidatus Hydrogenedentota bacterium]HPO84938.1 Gfo/Idh/MocA family oxidoreductase [Candidatus Hydrogenedentota bacterium]
MFRLGIVGSDNSHAIQFASLANLEEGVGGFRIPDVQVTHIYGIDPERTKEVAEKSRIPHIVENLKDMIGAVDGIACVWRHGSRHLKDTLPFLEAGIPAFVDKPLAASVEDAEKLIEAAQKAGVGFTSFSTLRYAVSTVQFINHLSETVGEIRAGVSTGPADRSSEYDGIFFYGIHAVEMMHAVFGYGCTRVTAVEHGKNVMAVCQLPQEVLVTLNFLGNATYVFNVTVFGTKGWQSHAVDSSTCYYEGMKTFLDCLRTGKWPLSAEQLLEPVKILAAVEESIKTGKPVLLG